MNTLDSRSLHVGACFAQTFPATALGEVKYVLVAGAHIATSPWPDTSNGFKIEVLPKTNPKPTQFTVAVKVVNGQLVPDAASLVIAVGDIVLWYRADNAPRRFAVVGVGPKAQDGTQFTFSSGAMNNEAIYTHAFGTPGTYEWIDSIGGNRPDPRPSGTPQTIQGTIEVSPFKPQSDADLKNYLAGLSKPTTIEIKGNTVNPPSVKILVNQTVVWKIYDGGGISITDKRLVPTAH